jgi:hypothetical protein
MNEYEYINDAIARETAYDEGYEAGKQAAAEQIFEDLVSLGGCSRGILLNSWDIAELKEKYGVK